MSEYPANIRGFELLQGVIARAVENPQYRQELLENTHDVLRQAGLTVDDDVEIVVHENEPNRLHLVIPSQPQKWEELDVEEVHAPLILEWPF